jgi:transposase
MNILQPIIFNPFYKAIEKVFNEVRIPFHFSKYSNKIYTNFVHVYLLVLKERYQASYRRLIKLADDLHIKQMLGIQKLPHPTTLQKFLSKIDKTLLEKLIRASHKLMTSLKMLTAIDSTGFSNVNPSYYYLHRCSLKTPTKNFIQTSLVVDTKTKLVLNISTSPYRQHDSQAFIPLIDKLKHNISCVLADKGYDSMQLRKYCWKNNMINHIPVKGLPEYQKMSDERILAKRRFRYKTYSKRTIIESVISAIKRTTGNFVNARTKENQQKQVILKVLTYNLEKTSGKITFQIYLE